MGWQDLVKNLKELDDMAAEVGWQGNVRYTDGTPVSAVARWQDKGNSRLGIPPTGFVRSTINENKAEWSRLAGLGAKAVAVGTRSPHQVLDALGQLAAGEIRAKIASFGDYPSSDPVIQRRRRLGRNTQKKLVDTGLMVTSCTSTVKKV